MRINISLLLFIYSVGALATAYTSQYVFGMQPCILCLYQRWPYFFVILFSVLSMLIRKNKKLRLLFVALCGLALVVGACIAFFHLGVEQGKFKLSDGCEVGNDTNPSSIEEMTMQLMGKPNVPCDKPQFVFLGISMAGWNFLFSGSLGVITLIMVFRLYKDFRYLKKAYGNKK